jgi:hypothetical protein
MDLLRWWPLPERKPQERERRVLMRAPPVPVLAVNDPCLPGCSRNPACSILPPIAFTTASA